MWPCLLRLLPTILALLPRGLGVFEWSYRDFSRWKTKGQCAQSQQSPINVASLHAAEDPALASIIWPSSSSVHQATLRATAHTWKVDWPQATPGGLSRPQRDKVTFNGKDFFLREFHYRSPSENTIDDRYFAMEAQHTHIAEDGQILVVSVMMNVAVEANPYLEWYLWHKFPDRAGTGVAAEVASPYANFMPKNKSCFQWIGSLTTPPCTTNTIWILLQRPVNISAMQLTAYRSAINDIPRNQLKIDTTFVPAGVQDWDRSLGINIRPLQPLGQRQVTRHTVVQAPPKVLSLWDRFGGWLVLLIGTLTGFCCICVAFCLYGCFSSRRDSSWTWEALGCDSRTVSRTNSFQSSRSSPRVDDIDEEDGSWYASEEDSREPHAKRHE